MGSKFIGPRDSFSIDVKKLTSHMFRVDFKAMFQTKANKLVAKPSKQRRPRSSWLVALSLTACHGIAPSIRSTLANALHRFHVRVARSYLIKLLQSKSRSEAANLLHPNRLLNLEQSLKPWNVPSSWLGPQLWGIPESWLLLIHLLGSSC